MHLPRTPLVVHVWQPQYCSSPELNAYLRVDDSQDDVQFDLAVTAASRAVDSMCRRQFGSATATRVYDARFDGRWYLDTDDFPTDDMTVTLDDVPQTVVSFPRNAAADGLPFTRISVPGPGTYEVAGEWGWSAGPRHDQASDPASGVAVPRST